MGLFKNDSKGNDDTNAFVKVLGTGCLKCVQLENNVKEALKISGKGFDVSHVTDIKEIAKYGVMLTPALVVGKDVVAVGKVLSVEDIVEILNKY